MTSTMTVAEIGWSIGFENISHFRRQFAAHFGIVPSQLQARMATSVAARYSQSKIRPPNREMPCNVRPIIIHSKWSTIAVRVPQSSGTSNRGLFARGWCRGPESAGPNGRKKDAA